jgi:hypothetical protein
MFLYKKIIKKQTNINLRNSLNDVSDKSKLVQSAYRNIYQCLGKIIHLISIGRINSWRYGRPVNKAKRYEHRYCTALSKVTFTNANSAQTVLYLFISMLNKVSTCKIFDYVLLFCSLIIAIFKECRITGRNSHCL